MLLDRRGDRAARRRAHATELKKRAAEADGSHKRPHDAIESGVADLGDESLKARIAELRAIRSQAEADAERAAAEADHVGPEITPATIGAFAAAARRRLRGPDGRFGRDHLRAPGQRVEVAEGEVRIMGSRSELLRQPAIANGVATVAGNVPRSVPEWRMGWDSNPRGVAAWRFSRPLPSTARPPILRDRS